MRLAVGVRNWSSAGYSIVLGPGTTVKVGGVISRTVIVWLTVAAESFPHASVAFHVRVRVELPAQLPSTRPSVPTYVTFSFPLHVSLAVGVPNTGVAGQSIVSGPGTTR